MSETVAMSSDAQPDKPDRLAAARAVNAKNGGRGPRVQRSAITNGSKLLAGIDGRSPWIRRLKDLLAEHTNDLGGVTALSAGERSLIRRIATITTELEFLEARFAQAETGAAPADLQLYLTASNNLRRLLEAIGLQRRMRDVTVDPLHYARSVEKGDAP